MYRLPVVPSEEPTKAAPRRIRVTINQRWSNADVPVEASTTGVEVTEAAGEAAGAAEADGLGLGAAIPTKLPVSDDP